MKREKLIAKRGDLFEGACLASVDAIAHILSKFFR